MGKLTAKSMTYQPARKGWIKNHHGKIYTVSLRQLGIPFSGDRKKDEAASLEAANLWWDAKRAKLEGEDPEAESRRKIATFKVWSFLQDFDKLDGDTRQLLVDSVLGKGEFTRIQRDAAAAVDAVVMPSAAAPDGGLTVEGQIASWSRVLQAQVATGQMSVGRFDSYAKSIATFAEWIGPSALVTAINADRVQEYYLELSSRVTADAYSPATAQKLWMTFKQWVNWLGAEKGLISVPGNLGSKRLRFQVKAKPIETYTTEEIALVLGERCPSDRTRLFILLGLNCGMYQSDISDLEDGEVDLAEGTLTRPRSKTGDRASAVVTRYRLWPETVALLRKFKSSLRVKGERGGNLWFTTSEGKPLVKLWLEGNKQRRYDLIQTAWGQLSKATGVKKSHNKLRKTAATMLGQHPSYKFFGQYFLSQAPETVADRHYIRPNDEEFFAACLWLRDQVLVSLA